METSGGLNRYSYCVNNPLKYSDPSGSKFNTVYTEPQDVNRDWGILSEHRDNYNIYLEQLVTFWKGSNGGSKDTKGQANNLTYDSTQEAWVYDNGKKASFEEIDAYIVGNPQGGGDTRKDSLFEFVGFNRGIPEFESRLMPSGTAVTPG